MARKPKPDHPVLCSVFACRKHPAHRSAVTRAPQPARCYEPGIHLNGVCKHAWACQPDYYEHLRESCREAKRLREDLPCD